MIRILANDGIHPDGQMLLEEAGYEVITEKVPQDQLLQELPNYDVIIIRSATKVRKDLIDGCPNLKVIARAGVGLDNVDYEYAREKGVEVMNTPAASSQSVAELAFAHMFSLARFLNHSNRELASGEGDFKALKKQYSKGVQLRGKTLGIVGFGRIGREAARIGLALGMQVLPADLYVSEADIDIELFDKSDIRLSIHIETVDFAEVLRKSDFLTIHVPAMEGALLGKEELAKMKNGAIVINTARGGIIEEDALMEALQSGKIGGAGIDVFDNEPTPRKDLLTHPRVSVSPHIGASTIEAQRNIGLELADRILAHFGDDK